jgi:hypothetical protein
MFIDSHLCSFLRKKICPFVSSRSTTARRASGASKPRSHRILAASFCISLGILLGSSVLSPGRSAPLASLDRDGQNWQAINWNDLPMGGMLSDLPNYVGQHIVTSGTKLQCDFIRSEPFRVRSPEGSIVSTIPVYPRALAETSKPFPSSLSSGLPAYEHLDASTWLSVKGYQDAVANCRELLKKDQTTSLNPGFLLFGTVERNNEGYNALVVDRVEFANYAVGMLHTLWNAVTDEKTLFALKLLLNHYSGN